MVLVPWSWVPEVSSPRVSWSSQASSNMAWVMVPPRFTWAPRNIPEKHCACNSMRRDISSPFGEVAPAARIFSYVASSSPDCSWTWWPYSWAKTAM